MPLTIEQRNRIVAEAWTWVRAKTPYRGWSAIKGAGADCGQIIYAVLRDCGHLPTDLKLPTDYSLQVAQHRASTEYIDLVASYMREIPESEVQAGDVAVFKLGHAYAHGAIVVQWPTIIHAFAKGGVRAADGVKHARLFRAERKFFTLRDEWCK